MGYETTEGKRRRGEERKGVGEEQGQRRRGKEWGKSSE